MKINAGPESDDFEPWKSAKPLDRTLACARLLLGALLLFTSLPSEHAQNSGLDDFIFSRLGVQAMVMLLNVL